MKRQRRRKGATLGLVVVCMLIIIVIGVGFFFLAKILGGGREMMNATDAGTLSLANQAILNPTVTINQNQFPMADFAMLGGLPGTGQAPSNVISLLAYNRCVAQVILIALNAQYQAQYPQATNGGPTGKQDAQLELTALNQLGSQLMTALYTPNVQNFNNAGNLNNIKMIPTQTHSLNGTVLNHAWMAFGDPTQNTQGLLGGSTNVYFLQNEMPFETLPAGAINTKATLVPQSTFGAVYQNGYLAGYNQLTINGVGPIYGVPVFPQQTAHLVGLHNFQLPQYQQPIANTPCNAWECSSTVNQVSATYTTGAVACAIVGAANMQNGQTSDFPAAIPGGYIVFINDPASQFTQQAANALSNTTNTFNNLLGTPSVIPGQSGQNPLGIPGNNFTVISPPGNAGPLAGTMGYGVDVSEVGTHTVMSIQQGALAAWIAFEQGAGPNPDTMTPPIPGTSIYDAVTGSAGTDCADPPTGQCLTDLKASSYSAYWPYKTTNTVFGNPASNCLTQLDGPGSVGYLIGQCVDELGSVQLTYETSPLKLSQVNNPGNWSQVDYAKASLLYQFEHYTPGAAVSIQAMDNNKQWQSGLGVYHKDSWFNGQPQAQIQTNGNQFFVPPGIAAWPDAGQFPLQVTGSIYMLLQSVNNATTGPFNQAGTLGAGCTTLYMNQLLQLCREIQPKTTLPQITTLLQQTPLPMGAFGAGGGLDTNGTATVEYLYLPGGNLNGSLVISKWAGINPSQNPNIQQYTKGLSQNMNNLGPGVPAPDGGQWTTGACPGTDTYQIGGLFVNTTNPTYPGMPGPGQPNGQPATPDQPGGPDVLNDMWPPGLTQQGGDDDLHDRPFVQMPPGNREFSDQAFTATDSSQFFLSSGGPTGPANPPQGGLLGVIEFSDWNGGETFQRIN